MTFASPLLTAALASDVAAPRREATPRAGDPSFAELLAPSQPIAPAPAEPAKPSAQTAAVEKELHDPADPYDDQQETDAAQTAAATATPAPAPLAANEVGPNEVAPDTKTAPDPAIAAADASAENAPPPLGDAPELQGDASEAPFEPQTVDSQTGSSPGDHVADSGGHQIASAPQPSASQPSGEPEPWVQPQANTAENELTTANVPPTDRSPKDVVPIALSDSPQAAPTPNVQTPSDQQALAGSSASPGEAGAHIPVEASLEADTQSGEPAPETDAAPEPNKASLHKTPVVAEAPIHKAAVPRATPQRPPAPPVPAEKPTGNAEAPAPSRKTKGQLQPASAAEAAKGKPSAESAAGAPLAAFQDQSILAADQSMLHSEPPAGTAETTVSTGAPTDATAGNETLRQTNTLASAPSMASSVRRATSWPQPSSAPSSSAPQLTGIEQARFVQRVARAFQAAQQGDGEIRLRLSPPELGAMRMEIRVQDGVLTARLDVDNQTARAVLLDNMPALRERLAEQNIRVEQFEVQVGGGDPRAGYDGGQEDRRQPRASPVNFPAGRDSTAEVADRPVSQAWRGNDRLDVRV